MDGDLQEYWYPLVLCVVSINIDTIGYIGWWLNVIKEQLWISGTWHFACYQIKEMLVGFMILKISYTMKNMNTWIYTNIARNTCRMTHLFKNQVPKCYDKCSYIHKIDRWRFSDIEWLRRHHQEAVCCSDITWSSFHSLWSAEPLWSRSPAAIAIFYTIHC